MYEHTGILCKYILFKNKIKESSHIFLIKKELSLLDEVTKRV